MNIFGLQELNIPEKDVEQLLVSLILDNRVHGHIDQVNQLLELGDRYLPYLDLPFQLYLSFALFILGEEFIQY